MRPDAVSPRLSFFDKWRLTSIISHWGSDYANARSDCLMRQRDFSDNSMKELPVPLFFQCRVRRCDHDGSQNRAFDNGRLASPTQSYFDSGWLFFPSPCTVIPFYFL